MMKGVNMAKANGKAGQAESVSGYFRKIFTENPRLLRSSSNKVLLDRWLKDHPGHTVVPKNVQQSLANVKSILRKRRRGRKVQKNLVDAQAGEVRPARAASRGLEMLEETIDE